MLQSFLLLLLYLENTKMVFRVLRTQEEIDELLNECNEQTTEGVSKFPGMSYEEGIIEVLRWLSEKNVTQPMEEED